MVLVVGASQNLFQTRYGTLFPADTTIIRIDNEPDPGNMPSAEYIRADIRPFLEGLLERRTAVTTTLLFLTPGAGTEHRPVGI